jgi:sterol desaturase/sphingolipid hydroxylase (fatty acid hydroxylase superfamily)
MANLLQLGISFFIALVIGSLVEYFVHRLMHAGVMFHKIHAKHHQLGQGQGWLLEFKDYLLPGLAIIWLGFLMSIPAGIGFAAGCTVYAALAAYAHQVQHERPELTFWLPRPVHHLHHSKRMWHHNFGILVDVWDRVFGTYKPVDDERAAERHRLPWASYFKIKWF